MKHHRDYGHIRFHCDLSEHGRIDIKIIGIFLGGVWRDHNRAVEIPQGDEERLKKGVTPSRPLEVKDVVEGAKPADRFFIGQGPRGDESQVFVSEKIRQDQEILEVAKGREEDGRDGRFFFIRGFVFDFSNQRFAIFEDKRLLEPEEAFFD